MPPPPEPPQRPTLWEAWSPWQLMVYALLLLGANMFWQAVMFQLTGSVFLPVAVAALLAIVLPLTGAAWWHGQSLVAAFDLRLDSRVLMIGLGAGLLAWLPASTLAGLSSELRPPDDSYFEFLREHLPTDLAGTLAAFGAAGVVAPFAEELLFRGLLYRTARSRWGPIGSAVLTSLFFGIAHWEPWSLFGLIAVGLVTCALYERTGSLVAPMLAHAVHNVISLALMLRWRDELGTGGPAGLPAWLAAAACTAVLVWLLRHPPARVTCRRLVGDPG